MVRCGGVLLIFAWLSSLTLCEAQSSSSTSQPSSSIASSTTQRSTSSSASAVPSPRPALDAATRISLQEKNVYTFVLNKTRPVYLASLPPVTGAIEVLLNVADLGSDDAPPRVVATTSDTEGFSIEGRETYDRSSGGTLSAGWNTHHQPATWEVQFDNGFGNWTHGVDRHGVIREHEPVVPRLLIGRGINDDLLLETVKDGNVTLTLTFVMFNKTAGTRLDLSGLLSTPPLLGDTTGTEALVFSPLRVPDPLPQPTFPNYTLPDPALPLLGVDAIPSNHSLSLSGYNLTAVAFVLLPTDTVPPDVLGPLSNSASAIFSAWQRYQSSVANPPIVRRSDLQWSTIGGVQGFRNHEVIGNLQPNTNYTVWAAAEDLTFLTSPAYFTTKEESFPCPILLPTDVCPGLGYAVPIAERPAGEGILDSIPDPYLSVITANLQAFSASLLSTACGRDRYSFVSTCLDCYNAYRDWVCRIVIPQCGPTNPAQFFGVDDGPAAPYTIERSADSPRNADLEYPFGFNELQPCISTCTQVDRVCPVSLGFICPHRNFNANESYAFFGRSNDKFDGLAESGRPGLDVWGNRWCNN